MSSFLERQKSLFNQLKEAEDQHSFSKTNKATTPQEYNSIDRHTYRKVKHEMKQFRGRESIYKRPEANLRECVRAKTIPDHIKNPQKWVYYSLADVTPDQMSDATNSATAHALVRKLEEIEAAKTEMDHDSDDFIFKKPTFQVSSVIKTPPMPDEKAIFKSSKVIMPEYVVGMTKKKEKKIIPKKAPKDTTSCEKKLELKLDHLYDGDE